MDTQLMQSIFVLVCLALVIVSLSIFFYVRS